MTVRLTKEIGEPNPLFEMTVEPFRGIVDNVSFNPSVFATIAYYVIVIIGLKKMVLAVIFRLIQLMRVDIIINFGIYRRFKPRHERRN